MGARGTLQKWFAGGDRLRQNRSLGSSARDLRECCSLFLCESRMRDADDPAVSCKSEPPPRGVAVPAGTRGDRQSAMASHATRATGWASATGAENWLAPWNGARPFQAAKTGSGQDSGCKQRAAVYLDAGQRECLHRAIGDLQCDQPAGEHETGLPGVALTRRTIPNQFKPLPTNVIEPSGWSVSVVGPLTFRTME